MQTRPPRWNDVWVVAGLLALSVLWAISIEDVSGDGSRGPHSLGYALLVAMVLPLLWRQRFPRTVVWLTSVAWLAFVALGYTPNPALMGLFVALYGLASYMPQATALRHAAGLLGVLIAWTAMGVAFASVPPSIFLAVPVALVIPLHLGFADRQRRSRVSEREVVQARLEQADYGAATDAVRAERARIARELHDVVAHEITVMTLQAEGARRRHTNAPSATNDPELTQTLATIASAGRKGLEEMQRMIGVLRASEQEANERVDTDRALAAGHHLRGVSTEDGRTPLPSLAALPALVRNVQRSGLPVTLEISGSAHVPAGVEVSAYRIIQEALTNTLKHGGSGARADVTVMRTADALRITVEDDGRGVSSEGLRLPGGHGLAGMGERVQALGGALSHGPRRGGGYEVHAVLPSRDDTTEPDEDTPRTETTT